MKWSERKAREAKKKEYEDTPSKGRKVSRPRVTEDDEVSKTQRHQIKRDEDIKKWRGGRS